jgi:hypothetical protein
VEDDLHGVGRDDRRPASRARDSQRDQPVALALPLVGGELVHVPGGQCPRVVAAAGGAERQEGAQFQPGPPGVVERPAAARAARRAEDAGEVVPGQVAQPPLGDPGQVDPAGPVVQPPPEVPGEDVAVVPGLLRPQVEAPDSVRDRGRDAGPCRAGGLAQAGVVRGQVGQGAQCLAAAVVRQPLQYRQFPPPVLAPGVPGHAPLDLGPGQRVQAPQVDLPRPHYRRGRRAPAAERRLVGVPDRDGQPAVLVAHAPRGRQDGASRAALPAVAPVVAVAQAQRGVRGLRADPDAAAAVAGSRVLAGQPPAEVRIVPVEDPVVIPAELVVMTQPEALVAGRAVRADPARLLFERLAGTDRRGRLEEGGPRPAAVAVLAPHDLVSAAQVTAAHDGPLAVRGQAVPPEDRVPGRDLDDVAAEQRVERRRADQRGHDLQPVPPLAGTRLRQQREGHRPSPQTARRAASNAGSCTSTCP